MNYKPVLLSSLRIIYKFYGNAKTVSFYWAGSRASTHWKTFADEGD